jgi:starch synthase (maltosyl-transferring)
MWALGFDSDNFQVTDLLDNSMYNWSRDTFVRLDPARPNGKVAHIARVRVK